MIWLLGEPEDTDVLWLALGLRERGERVEVILPDEIIFGSSLSYRIGSQNVSSELHLGDGRILTPPAGLVVNRLARLPLTAQPRPSQDATFVYEEWRAALAAWLRTLTCPVLNPPRAASLVGPVMPTAAWRGLAHAHGLACAPWNSNEALTSIDPVTVMCVGTRCIDPQEVLSQDDRERLLAVAAYVGSPLLGATFEASRGGVVFCDATCLPELRRAGPAVLDALLELASKERLSQ